MNTTYHIYHVDGTVTDHEIDWPRSPGYDKIKALLTPILNRAPLEHISVLHDGKARDMFVAEEGLLKNLRRNEKATAIYRNAWLTQYPKAEPEDLNFIVGPAILFDRRIWF